MVDYTPTNIENHVMVDYTPTDMLCQQSKKQVWALTKKYHNLEIIPVPE
jgi:hypothetical protein